MGRDGRSSHRPIWTSAFQSTLPAWGETRKHIFKNYYQDISIHSPRMGRDVKEQDRGLGLEISIHSPRMGRDMLTRPREEGEEISIHSPRMGETGPRDLRGGASTISIHSPRMGRDLAAVAVEDREQLFQSTLPAWGETPACVAALAEALFQSTLPAWGETLPELLSATSSVDFNPLSPHGERPASSKVTPLPKRFQSTLPAWGETGVGESP